MDWYYVESGSQRGPVGDIAFRDLQQQGVITADTLVWHAGMTDWAPLGKVAIPAVLSGAEASAPASAGEGSAVCAECGMSYPADEMIQFRGAHICAACKPLFFQRLKEGAELPGQFQYAGFWIRWAAVFLDWLILTVVGSMFGLFVGLFARALPSDEIASILQFLFLSGFGLLLGFAYETWFVGKFGATPGKMALGLKVVRADGSGLTYARAFGRSAARIVSKLILYIGFIMAAFDEEKQALHDRMCDTRVINARARG